MNRASTPCIRVCTLDPETGLCEGCGRTREEIGRWFRLPEEERAADHGRAAGADAQGLPPREAERPDGHGGALGFGALLFGVVFLVAFFAERPIARPAAR